MASRGAHLTFGIEWEFLLDPTTGPLGDLRHPQRIEPEPKWTPRYSTAVSGKHPAFRHLSVFLRQQGFKAICSMEYDQLWVDSEFAAQFPEISQSYGPLAEQLRKQDFYMIKTDASLIDYDRARSINLGDEFVKVEITTPVFHFHSQESYAQVKRAFGLITQNFRIKVNPSCGLHVHIGNGDNGFRFKWARNIAGLCWARSPLLDLVHPTHRGPGIDTFAGLRYYSRLAHDESALDLKDPDARELQPTHEADYTGRTNQDPIRSLATDGLLGTWVDDIQMGSCGARRLASVKDMSTLLHLITSIRLGQRLAYNFNNLQHQDNPNSYHPRTIEFRQHAGTTDAVEMTNWVRVCGNLVLFASNDDAKVARVIHRAVDGTILLGTLDTLDFMRAIGAKNEALCYARRFNMKDVVAERYVKLVQTGEKRGLKGIWERALDMVKDVTKKISN